MNGWMKFIPHYPNSVGIQGYCNYAFLHLNPNVVIVPCGLHFICPSYLPLSQCSLMEQWAGVFLAALPLEQSQCCQLHFVVYCVFLMCAELVILLYNLFPSEMSGEQRLKKTPFSHNPKDHKLFFPVTLTCFPENTHLLPGEMLLLLTCLPSLPLLHPHSLDSSAHLHTPLTVKGKTNPNTKSNLKFTYPQNQSLLVTWISTNPCSPLVQ